MQILRHSQIAVTMNVYSEAPSKATQKALKRLGRQLHGYAPLLYFAAVQDRKRPLPGTGNGLRAGWS